MVQEVVVGDGDCAAIALAEDVEDEVVSDGGWDTHPVGDGVGVLPGFGVVCALLEGAYDGLASLGLHAEEAGALAVGPAQCLKLLYRLPDSDHTCAAAGGVDDGVGEGPAALLGNLVAHGLLALSAVRLLEGREGEHAELSGELAGLLAGLADQSVHQMERASGVSDLFLVGVEGVLGHEYVGVHAGPRGVGGPRAARVSGGGNGHARGAKLLRL